MGLRPLGQSHARAALLAGDVPLSGLVEETVARQVCKQAAVKAGQVMARRRWRN